MFRKSFTELGKTAYLCCCRDVKLYQIQSPEDSTQKAKFIVEAPFEAFLQILEDKWDKPHKAGKPAVRDARKYFMTIQNLRAKAIKACERVRLSTKK